MTRSNTARYKIAAESAGSAPTLLTSPMESPGPTILNFPGAPVGLVRDTRAPITRRLSVAGRGSLSITAARPRALVSAAGPPATADAASGRRRMLLGLLNGGRLLGQEARVPDHPGGSSDASGAGRVFAPPFYWNGSEALPCGSGLWRQFLAPEALVWPPRLLTGPGVRDRAHRPCAVTVTCAST